MFEKQRGGTLHIPIDVSVGTPHNIVGTNPGGWVGFRIQVRAECGKKERQIYRCSFWIRKQVQFFHKIKPFHYDLLIEKVIFHKTVTEIMFQGFPYRLSDYSANSGSILQGGTCQNLSLAEPIVACILTYLRTYFYVYLSTCIHKF